MPPYERMFYTNVCSLSNRESTGQAVHSVSSVDLYWLPLGAGGHSVRLNGKAFEVVAALLEKRKRLDLYHSALEVMIGHERFVVEQAPVWPRGGNRGVVAEGPVGARWAGALPIFRYEVRCWPDGVISDADEAIESPRRLSNDLLVAQRLIALAPQVPTPTWVRDELRTGEMWNSNSIVSWLLARAGLDAAAVLPPEGGRAPGWRAGLVLAARQEGALVETR
jgi:hypothetical protein